MLAGRFAHYTDVRNNGTGPLLDETQTLAAWLDAAGYHTGLVGKYLNVYLFGRGPYVPEDVIAGGEGAGARPESLYGVHSLLVENGEPVLYGDDDYSTDVYAQRAVEFLQHAPSDEPLFLWFAPNAAHPPAVAALKPRRPLRRPRSTCRSRSARRTSATSRRGSAGCRRSTMPTHRPCCGSAACRSRRCSASTRPSGRSSRSLRARGELDETLIVYVSDKVSLGEHRWVGKLCPYDECIRVLFPVRLGVAHRIEPEIVSAADLAPTIVDLVGVAPETPFDGVSLLLLLRHRSRADRTGEVFAEWVGDGRVPAWELRRVGLGRGRVRRGRACCTTWLGRSVRAGEPRGRSRAGGAGGRARGRPSPRTGTDEALRTVAASAVVLFALLAPGAAVAQEAPPGRRRGRDRRSALGHAVGDAGREARARRARRELPRRVRREPDLLPEPSEHPDRGVLHTTGVYRQAPPFGRFDWFRDGSTLATWLDGAGYTTGLFGKY